MPKFLNLPRHGFALSSKVNPFYAVWLNMKTRCTNKNYTYYHRYGGRGIKICDRWLKSFENFRDDMYQSYLEHHKENNGNTSLDRIDVNGNYEPSNCRWATQSEQIKNRTISIKSDNYIEHLRWKKYYTKFLSLYLEKNINSKLFKELFGIELPEFKKYIESKFLPGMSWNNRGSSRIGKIAWQLDHIKEIRDFDLSKENDRKLCFHYTNYQPLWWETNRDKALARL